MNESTAKGKTASELFPGLMGNSPKKEEQQATKPTEQSFSNAAVASPPPLTNSLPSPPPPPDISWLKTGQFQGRTTISSIPTALILTADDKISTLATSAMEEFGFQIELMNTAQEAVNRLKHLIPGVIVLDTNNPNKSEVSDFHRHVCDLQMSKRRNIIYVLIGAQFRTLYNLHALSHSANLVINNSDTEHITVILRKGIQDHKTLFGPFTEAIQRYSS